MKQSKRIAITGGIGSGKSLVGRYLEKAGYPVLDCDIISREVLAEPDVEEALKKEFPQAFSKGALDRKKLAEIAFSSQKGTQALNAVMHPPIFRKLFERLSAYEDTVFVQIPLLAETGTEGAFDEVWLVEAPEEVRTRRVQERDGLSEAEVRKRMEKQAKDEKKRKIAHIILNNDGSVENLYRQIDAALLGVNR